jgi:peptidoglycan hydrolase-like protein with peptidoglycan-binding domain
MGTRSVREIQQALKDKGFDPGGIDGVWGRKTIAAVKQFSRNTV